ncbi:MAG: ACT domain-containing protein [Trichlorobacter sp.]|jgi:glycine cleavage system transcriptional repressor|nr:ACT domain-containing protein [Trichlorobacter sp.]
MTIKENISFAVSVVGADRPGIVAAITEVLFRLGCNISDSSSTMLAGQFATILIVTHTKPFGKEQLEAELGKVCKQMEMTLSVRELNNGEARRGETEGEICQITVYGADQPGIVYHVANTLAVHQINIMDLQTKLAGTKTEPVYIMLLEAALPDNLVPDDLEKLLSGVKSELQVEIGVRLITPVEL